MFSRCNINLSNLNMVFELSASDLQIPTKISLQIALKTEIKMAEFLSMIVSSPCLKCAQLKCWCGYSHTHHEIPVYICTERDLSVHTTQGTVIPFRFS